MPVVNVTLDRLKKFLPGVKVEKALDMLPFVGLDIEGIDGNVVRVEYNPNRPDFSSDYGIARALAGLVDKEAGMPKFRLSGKSGLVVKVDRSVKKVRPFVVALVAKNGRLDDETIKQLIAMQEDLHNGVGRRRKKASIGMHNLDAIKFPVKYTTANGDYAFVPLGGSKEQTVEQILQETETGRAYGHLLFGTEKYPVIVDSAGTTLSLPPIINGEATKVDERCRNLFVEVTATDKKAADDTLAVIAVTLFDAGFQIKTVTIADDNKKTETPDAATRKMSVDAGYINDILGMNLTAKEIAECLKKSRLDAKATGNSKIITCTVPRYRTDITHEIDLAEEVAIGYGVYRMEPNFPVSPTSGQRSALSSYFAAIRQAMTGLGMLESLNFSLTSREVQYSLCGRPENKDDVLAVDGTKSIEHEVLRSSLVPSLLQSLSRNVHEEYPQRLFEIGKTFHRQDAGGKIAERWQAAAVVAHGEAGYTEIKSAMQALFLSGFGMSAATKASSDPLYIKGRCARVMTASGKDVGTIGEITPLAIDNFNLRVPVAAFEIDLSALLSL
ncbi:phenylalanine--tRNA ligase subunit beta [Nitrososphaera viennensis]|uniref:phenylalanine--tRNA ligase n=2 Tax=Nitrososphaera viennensis TaxID=1034015 RepID=A0A060HFR5_9ARCH|nr:phenylalanine--tRNA ligase subunit beta [Nitrososphaera viennensis]AIC14225.1 phenylalanine--tRNA ligase beta chain [Nitrososphaera viennensis EN76]UVS69222.1 phenylalanine--tRNA ligase subunit beta [Nitrososphaera viennensis]